MKPTKIFLLLLLLSLTTQGWAQLTAKITGTVESDTPGYELYGAKVQVIGTHPVVGTITDANNRFMLEVPIGQQILEISCVGFETKQVDLVVQTGRTQELEVQLTPSSTTLSEVEVTAAYKKNTPLNPLSYSGARSFSTDETFRFAGSWGDPSRMVRAFAGVTPINDSRNDIVVRGNSPYGVQYRINGFEITNPNHFNAGLGMTGGQVTLLNTNMMENSDFHLGGWPATIGNALSGLFDIQYYSGIRTNYQMYFQMGYNGIELGAEGPLGRQKEGSFKMGNRYSIPDIMARMGMDMEAVPRYQDFTLTGTYDLGPAHSLSWLAIIGTSQIEYAFETEDKSYYNHINLKSFTALGGLHHSWKLQDYGHLDTRISFGRDVINLPVSFRFDESGESGFFFKDRSMENRYSIDSRYSAFLDADKRLVAGLHYDHFQGDLNLTEDERKTQQSYGLDLVRGYAQYEQKFSPRFSGTAGVHSMWLAQNPRSISFEPRLGLKYQPADTHTLALSGGVYAMTQNHSLYFVESEENGVKKQTNKHLDFTKNAQVTLAYDWSFAPNWNVKLEGYYQYSYDVPVYKDPAENFSVLNIGAGENYMQRVPNLLNKGKGQNYGVELTLERYLANNFYLLATGTVFRSLYTNGFDNVWLSTAFDSKFTLNLTTGYEMALKKGWSIHADAQVNFAGGLRYTPFDKEATVRKKQVILDNSRPYSLQYPNYARLNLRFGYRHSRKTWSDEMSVDLQNVTNRKNVQLISINPATGEELPMQFTGFMPMVHYRVYFSFK